MFEFQEQWENLLSRRKFLKDILKSVSLVALSPFLPAGVFSQAEKTVPGAKLLKPARDLGKTGHKVCLFSLGGQAALEKSSSKDNAVALLHRAIDLGVNYIDTAPAYGPSQDYIGEVMKTRRKEVFLATKTHDRTKFGSLRLLEQNLKRLQTDHVDLFQIHNLMFPFEVDYILSKKGAVAGLEKAREEGLVKYIGVTGHYDPQVLKKAINLYPFDTVLMALNPADRHFSSFVDEVLPLASGKNMGIIGMKVPSRGKIFQSGGITTINETMNYVLSLPVSTIIIGCDTMAQLEENAQAAVNFKPLSSSEMKALEQKTSSYAEKACWYKKT